MSRRWLLRWAVVAVTLIAGSVLWSSPVAAHTEFESSTPTDGDVEHEIVGEVVIRFTAEATPVGEGFTVLDPSGLVRSPTTVTIEDDKVFVLEFDPPLAGGPVGVRWMVQAQDAHPIEGSFSFTVTAQTPTAPPTTSTPTTTAPTAPTSSTADDISEEAAADQPAAPPPPEDGIDSSGIALEEFLATETSTSGQLRQLMGRIGSYLGVMGAIGGLAFLASTLSGRRREIDTMLATVAGLGVLTTIGAGIEYWGWLAQSDGSVLGEMTSTPGLAMTLRVVGGLVVAGSLSVLVWSSSGADRRQITAQPLSASVFTEAELSAFDAEPDRRWDPRGAPVAWIGSALLVASFWFDGHTVSQGPRTVHAAVNSVHVVAAAVWVGGVVSLLALLATRHRRGEPSRAAELIVRFSSIATVALVAVVLGGVLMASFVLDSPRDLVSTEWGETLLVKTAAVGIAALGGAYNHFRLRPQVEAAPDKSRLQAQLRSTLIVEAMALTFVVITTGWLVAAAI